MQEHQVLWLRGKPDEAAPRKRLNIFPERRRAAVKVGRCEDHMFLGELCILSELQECLLALGSDRAVGRDDFHKDKQRMSWPEIHQDNVRQILISPDLQSDSLCERVVARDNLVAALAEENDAGLFEKPRRERASPNRLVLRLQPSENIELELMSSLAGPEWGALQLQPLPLDLFPSFTEGKRSVHLDGHVEYEKAYYSVPPEYTRQEVWVRGESKLVQIYTQKMELIVTHARVEPGRTSTADAHIHPLKRRLADQGVGYLVNRCQQIGPSAGAWVVAVQHHRPIESIRVNSQYHVGGIAFTQAQLISVLLFLGGAALLAYVRRSDKSIQHG